MPVAGVLSGVSNNLTFRTLSKKEVSDIYGIIGWFSTLSVLIIGWEVVVEAL